MKIEGRVVLVTGANRGLGKAFAEAFLAAGAAKVYACARDPSAIADARLAPVKLDVTSATDVRAAAQRCGDVDVLVNNAGVMLATPAMRADAIEMMKREMDVNVYGLLAMTQAFAPVLARNGGGAVVNMLSVVSWFTSPLNATYCASKHAALAITEATRIELEAQGTRVIGVYAGFVDTEMAAGVGNVPKVTARQVAERTVEGVRSGTNTVLADERAEQAWKTMRADPTRMEAEMKARWEEARAGRERGGRG